MNETRTLKEVRAERIQLVNEIAALEPVLKRAQTVAQKAAWDREYTGNQLAGSLTNKEREALAKQNAKAVRKVERTAATVERHEAKMAELTGRLEPVKAEEEALAQASRVAYRAKREEVNAKVQSMIDAIMADYYAGNLTAFPSPDPAIVARLGGWGAVRIGWEEDAIHGVTGETFRRMVHDVDVNLPERRWGGTIQRATVNWSALGSVDTATALRYGECVRLAVYVAESFSAADLVEPEFE